MFVALLVWGIYPSHIPKYSCIVQNCNETLGYWCPIGWWDKLSPNNTDNLEWQILPADNLLNPSTYVSKFVPNAIENEVITHQDSYGNFSLDAYYD